MPPIVGKNKTGMGGPTFGPPFHGRAVGDFAQRDNIIAPTSNVVSDVNLAVTTLYPVPAGNTAIFGVGTRSGVVTGISTVTGLPTDANFEIIKLDNTGSPSTSLVRIYFPSGLAIGTVLTFVFDSAPNRKAIMGWQYAGLANRNAIGVGKELPGSQTNGTAGTTDPIRYPGIHVGAVSWGGASIDQRATKGSDVEGAFERSTNLVVGASTPVNFIVQERPVTGGRGVGQTISSTSTLTSALVGVQAVWAFADTVAPTYPQVPRVRIGGPLTLFKGPPLLSKIPNDTTPVVGGGPVTQNLSANFTETAAIGIINTPQKVVALTETATFTVAKTPQKPVALTQATALAVTKQAQKPIALSEATSVAATKQPRKAIALTEAATLAASKVVSKTVAFTESTSFSAVVIKAILRTISLTQNTTLTVVKQAQKIIGLSQSESIAVTKTPQKAVALSETTSVSSSRSTSKVIALSETASLAISKVVRTTKSLSETASLTTTKLISRSIALSESASLGVTKQAQKVVALAESTSVTASMLKLLLLIVSLSQSTSLTIIKTAFKPISFSEVTSFSVAKTVQKAINYAQSTTFSAVLNPLHFLSVALTAVTSLTARNTISKTISLTESASIASTRSAIKSAFTFVQVTALSVLKRPGKSVSVSQSSSMATSKSVAKVIEVDPNTTIQIAKLVRRTVTLNEHPTFVAIIGTPPTGGGELPTFMIGTGGEVYLVIGDMIVLRV